MFLKIHWNNKTKKVSFSPELQTHEKFTEILTAVTGLNTNCLEVTFFDVENEKLPINDKLDFDYFLAGDIDGKYKEVFLERKISESEIFFVGKEIELQESFKKLDLKMSDLTKNSDQSLENLKKVKCEIPTYVFPPKQTNKKAYYMGIEDFTHVLPPSICKRLPAPVTLSEVCSPLVSQKDVGMNKVKAIVKCEVETPTLKSADSELKEKKQCEFFMKVVECTCNEECPFKKTQTLKQPLIGSKKMHSHVTCDVCFTRDIVGKRYKCLICVNFDICETCEAKDSHNQHPMIRCSEIENEYILAKITKKFKKMKKRVEKAKKEADKIQKLKEKLNAKNLKNLFKNSVEPAIKRAVECFEIRSSELEKQKTEQEVKVQTSSKKSDDLKEQKQNEKKELLKFIFGDAQNEVIEELVARFENLNIGEICEEIEKNNRIIQQMHN